MVVINIEYAEYSLNFDCSYGPNTVRKMLKIAFPNINILEKDMAQA